MDFPQGAPELSHYQDEPRQLPAGAPGKNPYLRLCFERRGGRTILVDLARRAPLLVQQALYYDEAMPDLPCVMIVSTSGGILQGDRVSIEIGLGTAAQAYVTTQSATKIQEMDANFAAQTQDIVLGDDAYLEYLPEAVIPYRHARFITQTRITIPASATLLYSEILMPGRKYYKDGELFAYDVLSSKVAAIRPDGADLFTEKFIIEPSRRDVRGCAVLGSYHVLANVLLLAPKEHADRILAATPAVIDVERQCAAGASRLPNDAGLIFKVLGMEREPVQRVVREFWSTVRRTVVGVDVPREFAWR